MKNSITADEIKIETEKCRSDIAYFAKKYLRIRRNDGSSVSLPEDTIKRLKSIHIQKI